MKSNPNEIIGNFLREKDTVFTAEEFCSYLKENGIKISLTQIEDLLHSSDYVFSLVNNEYVTRSGVFTGRFFSFKPSREEIEKGCFLIGHRCVPFCNPELSPDSFTVVSDGEIVQTRPKEFSMNLALDTFALFGEGYVLPYIVNDISNTEITLGSIQYGLPSSITLTAWPFNCIKGGQDIEYGDRVICKVVDWQNGYVEMEVLKENHTDLVVSQELIDREDWYLNFENGILESLDRHGPCASIEEQLAFLYLENQELLCKKNSGSVEEFLSHTTRISFQPYGVESRIWRDGEAVPFVGEWNNNSEKEQIIMELALCFSPQIIDCFIKNNIYIDRTKKTLEKTDDLLNEVLPKILLISPEERNIVLLNIEKRRDIIKNNYNPFADYSIGDIRKRALTLFSKVCSLFCSIGCAAGNIGDFPQQELVILSQLYGHLVRLLEEFENQLNYSRFPVEDVSLSLDGMEETFEEVGSILEGALEANSTKGFELISDKS